eukprot:2399413-Alexandrium_andersonii.AAC.1
MNRAVALALSGRALWKSPPQLAPPMRWRRRLGGSAASWSSVVARTCDCAPCAASLSSIQSK